MAAIGRPLAGALGRLTTQCIVQRSLHNASAAPFSTHGLPASKPEQRLTATLIPGDGVGPELCHVVMDVFKAAGIPVDFEQLYISEIDPHRSEPLETVVESIKRNGICLKGILASPEYNADGEAKTLNMKLRDELDLYANVVHVKSLPGLKCNHVRHKNVDMIVIREQTEGEYSALEHESVKGVVECLKITTREKCNRIAKFAFDYALKHGRKKVTAVHKANIMKLGDGLFLKSCADVAAMYPDIEFNNMIIDNCAMQLVSNPHQFDVMVLPNLYGNIVDNLAAGLVGGAGVVAGSSYSSHCVVFEQGARHTFAEGMGKNVANPTAMLLCSANMLKHAGLDQYSAIIKGAVDKVIKAGKVKTRDIGGYSKTSEFERAIIENLHSG
ncbi:isocitrate dehydrogenase [NAD] subunit beta, mitochondrial isoform X1 [Hyalella azteca]|uniref:Isocitrate dehydrogenase [NAD] subunit, mitochondrial n=1 Tax=Hyalella azteca TaxID=294128 RepID=A0A8B7NSE0_HYAAZ|nr:isocitrate dehydrogenase [NAD] subunit beta, mitochondrial isoform X1 [Hyalella azteca]